MDCFRVLPAYCNDLRQQYNLFLSNLAKSNILDYLLSQIQLKPVVYTSPEPEMWKEILDADYALA